MIEDASIAQLQEALTQGRLTAVTLALACLDRIAAYDRAGPCLNAVPVLNPEALAEARASDLRRAKGQLLGPLDGIPYTAKNSYKVRGLTVAAGSPAFADLVAHEDAHTIACLRAAGAVLIGLTNMPPMANGGMQRGLYGRAESPYRADYLTSAFASGSSNGSGSATAAGFAAFGLGEETWSSGRAPAACNALCAWTPSRGVISMRGNWPLVPTMDVVVPHTRSMADLLALVPVLTTPDPQTRGDFWRAQPWIPLPALNPAGAPDLKGRRFALPRLYANADPLAGTAPHPGIGGPTGRAIQTRASILALLQSATQALTEAGAEVVLSDFPLIENYEGDRPDRPTIWTRGLVPADFKTREILDLSAWAWDDFLKANGHPGLAQVDGAQIFPAPPGSLPDRYDGFGDALDVYPAHVAAHPLQDFRTIPLLEQGLRGLEATRRIDLEDWMDRHGFDAVIFPALADVGRADADTERTSADHAWQNGVWVANGNLAIRHLGIPTVTVPMGMMEDIAMPAGLTFAGRAGEDHSLMAWAAGFEALGRHRLPPPRTPPLALPPQVPCRPGPARAISLAAEGPDLVIALEAAPVYLSLAGQPIAPLQVSRHPLPPPGTLVLALWPEGQAALAEVAPR